MNKVLFLCTGNYYRSRFAEYLFNNLALKQGLNWVASSRGLALELGINNIGPLSQYTITGLANRGVSIAADMRYPLPLKERDLATATKIIAVDELEHRPLILKRFPDWIDTIEYWLVHDIHQVSADLALKQIEDNIEQLIKQIITLGTDNCFGV